MDAGQAYLDLLKKTLTDFTRIEFDEYKTLETLVDRSWKIQLLNSVNRLLSNKDFVICKRHQSNRENRINGRDWPSRADTMIGLKRLDNLEYCIKDVVTSGIEGDLIETGVWRGGATIFMKAVLNVLEDKHRIVWVADSFEGLPKPNPERYAADWNDEHYKVKELAISMETVRSNFEKYDLLDDRIVFLKGWFKDTLPSAPIKKLSILRLDGDMYESTWDALVNLYPKLSCGGYVIIDDWTAVRGCKAAVEDYRRENNIREEITSIDWSGVYWKKTGE